MQSCKQRRKLSKRPRKVKSLQHLATRGESWSLSKALEALQAKDAELERAALVRMSSISFWHWRQEKIPMLQGLTAELQAMKSQADRSGKDLEDIAAWPAVLPFSLSLLQPSGEIRRAVPKRGREVALAEHGRTS